MDLQRAFELRTERDNLAEKFRKLREYACKQTQNKLDEICNEIESLADDSCVTAKFLWYSYDDKTRETTEHVERCKIIPSDNEDFNKFFVWCLKKMEYLDKWSPVYHVHDRFPYSRRIKNSLDIYEAVKTNLFVDDFVYKTWDGNIAICLGNIKQNPWHTRHNCCLTSNGHPIAHLTAYIWRDGKVYEYFSCMGYADEKKIGEL